VHNARCKQLCGWSTATTTSCSVAGQLWHRLPSFQPFVMAFKHQWNAVAASVAEVAPALRPCPHLSTRLAHCPGRCVGTGTWSSISTVQRRLLMLTMRKSQPFLRSPLSAFLHQLVESSRSSALLCSRTDNADWCIGAACPRLHIT